MLNDSLVRASAVKGVAHELAARVKGRVIVELEHGLRGFGLAAADSEVELLLSDPRVISIEENALGHLSYTTTETYLNATT